MADGRDGMLHAPITDLPSWHGSLDPGRKLLVGSRPQCGQSRAVRAISWCRRGYPADKLLRVAVLLCTLAVWPWKDLCRNGKVV